MVAGAARCIVPSRWNDGCMAAIGDQIRLFADETRLRVLHLLATEPLTVAELQDVLDLSQSSISGHLAKLKSAGIIHDLAEGSARRYRLRDDAPERLRQLWATLRTASLDEPPFPADRARLAEVRSQRTGDWVDRVAGDLHRAYAPGRTWEALTPGLLHFARFGRVIDIGAGDGALLELIAPHADAVTCIDPNQRMVEAGRNRANKLGFTHVTWHRAPGEKIPIADASHDSALLLQSLQYVDSPERVLAEARRVLIPGGRLMILTLAAHDSPDVDAFGHRHRGFAADQLRRLLRGMRNIQIDLLPSEPKPPRLRPLMCTAIA